MLAFHLLLCTSVLERDRRTCDMEGGIQLQWRMANYRNHRTLTFTFLLTHWKVLLSLKILNVELILSINEQNLYFINHFYLFDTGTIVNQRVSTLPITACDTVSCQLVAKQPFFFWLSCCLSSLLSVFAFIPHLYILKS